MSSNLKMMMGALAVVVTVAAGAAYGQQDSGNQAGQASALSWLAGIDAGHYPTSWDEASQFFKSKITKDQWVADLNQVRSPLGKLNSRQSIGSQLQNPPGAPAGGILVIQFKSSFEKLSSAVETVSLVKEKDGQWRAAGYYIKPD